MKHVFGVRCKMHVRKENDITSVVHKLSCAERWSMLLIFRGCAYHNYLLTYPMVQSPSWEAKWFAASQEIPCISRNPKVHYRTHKRPPPVSILGQPNLVHTPTSHLLEIHPNIIHPSTRRSPQWSPSLRFPQQDAYIICFKIISIAQTLLRD